MAMLCRECPLRRTGAFQDMTEEDVRQTQRFKAGELTIDAGTLLLMEGSNTPQLFTAQSGMGLRYKTLPNGRRQVLNFVFPGDFIGLQAGLMGEMQHSVEATTDMRLCVFDRASLYDFFRHNPTRAYDITWLAAVEEHFLGEALATVGQRTAAQSVAWALARLWLRGEQLNLVRRDGMPLPYRQQDLADALGLSLVHTNKTLARLRETQLANWADGRLKIHDLQRLADEAEMELEERPRKPLI